MEPTLFHFFPSLLCVFITIKFGQVYIKKVELKRNVDIEELTDLHVN
jgi:hypothetical protein